LKQLVRPLGESTGKWISTLPIIMPPSRQSEQDIVEGLQSGPDDYIVSSPSLPEELAACLLHTAFWCANRSRLARLHTILAAFFGAVEGFIGFLE
jgi:DNA-binding NarL/FixJ family response regulator